MTVLQAIKPGDSSFVVFRSMLEAASLPTSDLDEGDAHYFAFEAGGFGGFVHLDDAVLLRSIVVPAAQRRRGLGGAILETLLEIARSHGAREAWLLTTTAEAFFAMNGFERVARAQAPAAIIRTSQFKSLCPDSAALMRRALI